MTLQQLRSQVLRRLKVGMRPTPAQEELLAAAVDEVLLPMRLRDERAIDRKQAPYNFEPRAVLAYERQARAKLQSGGNHDARSKSAAAEPARSG